MITPAQLADLTRRFKTNETVVYREYLQILVLKTIYDDPLGKEFFSKAALRFIYCLVHRDSRRIWILR